MLTAGQLGRTVRTIMGKIVWMRSQQKHCVAVCDTEGCFWHLNSRNATGAGAIHAASHRHKVVITREVITEYDGETPDKAEEIG